MDIYQRLDPARTAWGRGVRLQTIIKDGWGRAFHPDQTLNECITAGYSLCVAEPLITSTWARMDRELNEFMSEQQKFFQSALITGTGVMLDGQHIPNEDFYVPMPDEVDAALVDAQLMNENMRLYGTIDKPKI